MLQFEAKALVELSATDEVWEGENVLLLLFIFLPVQIQDKPYHMLCVCATNWPAGDNPDDRLQKAYAEFTRMCKSFKIRP